MRFALITCFFGFSVACEPPDNSGLDWRAIATAQGLAICGDGACDARESCVLCPSDCACDAGCGDGVCAENEGCLACAVDCGACEELCGDDRCSGFENCEICADDCGECALGCGDGHCTADEDCQRCPSDCGACELPVCGDGVCEGVETCANCVSDCGRCPDVCGDDTCTGDEDCGNCEGDCGVCVWPADLENAEDELLVLVNNLRTSGGACPTGSFAPVPALALDENLRWSSRFHSLDLGESRYFDHTGRDGRSPFQRMLDAGYTGQPRAENIAAGNSGAQATFNQWLGSEGHCRNMVNPSYDEIGIGYARVNGSPFTHYWTQNFGAR